jgi:hypothetical protein
MSPPTLCRSCMRNSHLTNPFHRIECWIGTFFRRAHLWEVGVYILVPHHSTVQPCATLRFQISALEQIQVCTDDMEQVALRGTRCGLMPPATPALRWESNRTALIDVDDEGDADDADEADELLVIEEDHLPHYLSPSQDNEPTLEPTAGEPDNQHTRPDLPRPRHDALNNHYVRIIHNNGIHDLAVVTCHCLGGDAVHADLVYCKLIPASFSTYKTLFTVDALDDFRLSNLECKASAYQYFQKLRRLTAPASPATTPNFYQELLRISRLWRWLKKRKWAGHGHVPRSNPDSSRTHSSHSSPLPSTLLANFCPACPQPGLNLPTNWENDPNRLVGK